MEGSIHMNGSVIMPRLLIITPEIRKITGLGERLERNGFVYSTVSYNNGFRETLSRQLPDLLLVEMGSNTPDSETQGLIQRLKQRRRLPVVALIPREMLNSVNGHLDADDFLTSPYDVKELVLRINRLLQKNESKDSNEIIKRDGLMIDLARCEVAVEGVVAELTFKEYELIKLLAGYPGRVYTREALLDRIWGYDYYGGDRTVDVHVRRLRSKIEDPNHTFIETVRNIGYRFKAK
jgi:two-component system alkaline phosphatase synthesis response regulator PhoP